MKTKIYGAGSIGNHLAQASRRMGWDVVVVDKDPKALERMKNDIYPARYGGWDNAIELFTLENEPKGGFDVIYIGTPPQAHVPLALSALAEKPKVLQIEKPLCGPGLEDVKELEKAIRASRASVIVGYDHAISKSIGFFAELLRKGAIGEVLTLDVEFREHWQGIFKAHPWLSGPADTYLGFRTQGGGASGEHSHALHLWQYLAGVAGLGTWKEVSAVLKMEQGEGGAEYDSIAAFTLMTDKGKIGRCVQDVVTLPTRKWIRAQGTKGLIEWYCGGAPKGDLVRYTGEDGNIHEQVFEKTRPDDFYEETLHIQDIIEGKIKQIDSPISFESGLAVMKVLNTVYAHGNACHAKIVE